MHFSMLEIDIFSLMYKMLGCYHVIMELTLPITNLQMKSKSKGQKLFTLTIFVLSIIMVCYCNGMLAAN